MKKISRHRFFNLSPLTKTLLLVLAGLSIIQLSGLVSRPIPQNIPNSKTVGASNLSRATGPTLDEARPRKGVLRQDRNLQTPRAPARTGRDQLDGQKSRKPSPADKPLGEFDPDDYADSLMGGKGGKKKPAPKPPSPSQEAIKRFFKRLKAWFARISKNGKKRSSFVGEVFSRPANLLWRANWFFSWRCAFYIPAMIRLF